MAGNLYRHLRDSTVIAVTIRYLEIEEGTQVHYLLRSTYSSLSLSPEFIWTGSFFLGLVFSLLSLLLSLGWDPYRVLSIDLPVR